MDIKVEYTNESLWGNVDAEDEGYDVEQSEAQFEQMIVDHFYDEYPQADVQVFKTNFDRITVDGWKSGTDAMDQLVEKVWNGEWQVAA